MKVLGLEVSTTAASVAIIEDGKLLGEYFLNRGSHQDGLPHSEGVFLLIDRLTQDLRLKVEELDGIAVATGPGGLTGLRVGISVAKGLGLAFGLPLVGLFTLEALAACLPYTGRLICPILDAKQQEVYTALFRWEEGELHRLWEDCILAPDQLAEQLGEEQVVFLGDAVGLYGDLLCRKLERRAELAPPYLLWPRASRVAELGLRELSLGHGQKPDSLMPHYVRRPAAEVNWKARFGATETFGLGEKK